MAEYKSSPVIVNTPAETLAEKFSDFSVFEGALEKLPAEERAKVGSVTFSKDTIFLQTPQVGAITFEVVERTPISTRLKATGTPVAMDLEVIYKPVDAQQCEMTGVIKVDIPVMLRPMIGPTMQKAADQLGQLFARLA